MFESILEFLKSNNDWVNWTVFLLVFLESLVIVGLFTPATLIVPAIGALAFEVGIGPLEICLYAAAGMILGDSISYSIGRSIGNRLFDWIPKEYHPYLLQAQKFMEKYGIMSVALGRFIGPLRCLVPITAGSLGMRKSIFFPVTLIASPIWTSLYVLVGYFLGVVFIQYFNYALIGMIFVITIYVFYKDPMKLREKKS